MVSFQQFCVVDAKLHVLFTELGFVIALLRVDRGDAGEHVCGTSDRNSGDGDKPGLVKRTRGNRADTVDAHKVA